MGLKAWVGVSVLCHLLLLVGLAFAGVRLATEREPSPFRVELQNQTAAAQQPQSNKEPELAIEPAPPKPEPVHESPPAAKPEIVKASEPAVPTSATTKSKKAVREAIKPNFESPAEPAVDPPPQGTEEPVQMTGNLTTARSLPSFEASLEGPEKVLEKPAEDAAESAELTAAYLRRISEMVDRNKRYPRIAARRRLQGSVLISALLDSSGAVLTTEIVEDPDPLLSRAALDALKSASPFGPLPGGRETLEVSVPVRFVITR
jgi:TonB family protein